MTPEQAKCPKCGAPRYDLVLADGWIVYSCGSVGDSSGELSHGLTCLNRQLAAKDTENAKLRKAIRRLIELDVDATAYEDGTPLTKDAIMLRDAWREAVETAKEKQL